ncbi:hypothetical protein L204_103174 [Cryptococcus depauperatus]|nr:hypothetical protein L204_00080 [Cryptococcus depauperatus CBS 7855]
MSTLPDLRPPKSPKRFFTSAFNFSSSSPLPSLPTSTHFRKSSRDIDILGGGVTVVKTPQDAVAGMKQAAGLMTPPAKASFLPPVPPMPSLSSLPVLPSLTKYHQPTKYYLGHQTSQSVDKALYYSASVPKSTPTIQRSTSAREDLRSVGVEKLAGKGLMKSPSAAPLVSAKYTNHSTSEHGEEHDKVGPMPMTPGISSRGLPFTSLSHARSGSSSNPNFTSYPPVFEDAQPSSSTFYARSPAYSSGSLGSARSSSSSFPPKSFSTQSKRPSFVSHRDTMRPLPRSSGADTSFHATLLSCSRSSLPPLQSGEQEDMTIVNLEFAYSLSDQPKNECVSLPLATLKKGGGKLVEWIEQCIKAQEEEEGGFPYAEAKEEMREEKKLPDMTDGESSEDSELEEDYDLSALLRDEYLHSLFISDPSPASHTIPLPTFPSPSHRAAPLPPVSAPSKSPTPPKSSKRSGYKRAQTRNQYTQLLKQRTLGSSNEPTMPALAYTALSSSAMTEPLHIRRRGSQLSLAQAPMKRLEGRPGILTEMRVFLTREAGAYHHIAHRLLTGRWPPAMRDLCERVDAELEWLGMKKLVQELNPPSFPTSRSPDLDYGLKIQRTDLRPLEYPTKPDRPEKSRRRSGGKTLGEQKDGNGKWKEKAKEKNLVLRGGFF